MKINYSMLEEFMKQAAECLSPLKDKDPGTLQHYWFVSADNIDCEIRATY